MVKKKAAKKKSTSKASAKKKSPVHVLVTGGGKGIGAAISEAFAALGARVTIVGRDKAALSKHIANIKKKKKAASLFATTCDVTSEKSVAKAFAEARKKFGPIKILVNNAGGADTAPFIMTSSELWDAMIAQNLKGAFLCAKEVLAEMLVGNFGRIINISSTAGLDGFPYVSAYCAAKHGLVGMTRALSVELYGSPVTVNAICPGFTETDMFKKSLDIAAKKTGRSKVEIRDEFRRMNPHGQLVKPKEIADAVLWLCLPDQDELNGKSVVLPGGDVIN